MSVLSRDDFFNRINAMVGTNTSDEAVSFIEDMTDTYNNLEQTANGDGVNWEQRYHELDESWKTKYKNRFFSGNGSSNIPLENTPPEEDKVTADNITIEDLFS